MSGKATAFVAGVLLASMFWIVLAQQSYCTGSLADWLHMGDVEKSDDAERASLALRKTSPIAIELLRALRCPLYPRKRTCAVQLGMSALCQ